MYYWLMKTGLLVTLLIAFVITAYGNSGDTVIPRKKYHTKQLNGAITLDGIPQEEAWNAVDWGGDFIQWQPNEGKPPSQQTNFKILYDDKFLYVAYRCHDVGPDSIVKRMGRRDEFPGDWVEINIDSHHDLRTAFSFTLSVSGVRSDETVSEDTRWDVSYNPIWFAKTNIDDKGWTGEIKIPLSQLRYGNEPEKIWGFQINRRIFRKEERSTWQFIPGNSGVWVSAFGELHGLKNLPMHKQVEIAPYVVAQADKYKKQPGNPFAKGFDKKITAGLDGKFAVTNDLILDLTVNPDFGQVEADPSQVRIDGFQSFFEERRPFFIESKNIFDYRLTGSIAGGDYDSDLLFYSRRIGSSPHISPSVTTNEFAKTPVNTTILGAAKFSGKTRTGWSVGVLESVTEREMAVIDSLGKRRESLVEPLTNFFVARLQKDINSGNTVLGGIFTGVNRENGLQTILPRSANSGGFDFLHYWKNRNYYIRGNIVFSHLTGTKEAMLRTQTSFEHLFQRTDATEVSVDSNRTSLTGMGGTFKIGKSAGKSGRLGQVFLFETGVTLRSPGLELNDIGFMLASNEINHFTWAGFYFPRSFSIFRMARINYNHWLRWDYSGKLLFNGYNFNTNGTFKNNWQAGTAVTWAAYGVSNNALRGATSIMRLPGINHNIFVGSDFRKKFYGNFNFSNFWGFEKRMRTRDAGISFSIQPLDAMRIVLSGNYSYNFRQQDQFVSNVKYNGITRSIVGEVKQKTLRFTARLNYNITPDLTVQYYGQPFITRPLYNHFAYVKAPLAKDFDERFQVFTPAQISLSNGRYYVDENIDGTADYSFGKPDFNFVQFRSNLVVRWEYKPGSELYLVWSQGNTPNVATELDEPLFENLFENVFAEQARNIFLVKWTYRFLR
jgi:hypothetical protein